MGVMMAQLAAMGGGCNPFKKKRKKKGSKKKSSESLESATVDSKIDGPSDKKTSEVEVSTIFNDKTTYISGGVLIAVGISITAYFRQRSKQTDYHVLGDMEDE